MGRLREAKEEDSMSQADEVKKPKRKRCQYCGGLVPKDDWTTGLCGACMAEHIELECIVGEYA
jgi:hypothetical protein